MCPVSEWLRLWHDFGGDELLALAEGAAWLWRGRGVLGEQCEDGFCGFGELAAPEVQAPAKALECCGFCGVREDAVVPDFDKTGGQDVLEEPAQELFAAQLHGYCLGFIGVVFVAEGNRLGIYR